MITEMPVKKVLPERPIPHGEEPQRLPRLRFSAKRLAMAFSAAVLADGISFFLTLTPPVQWVAPEFLEAAAKELLEERWKKTSGDKLPDATELLSSTQRIG